MKTRDHLHNGYVATPGQPHLGKAAGVVSFGSSDCGRFLLMLAFTACSLVAGELHSDRDKELKAFPPAGEGMRRFAIVLPHRQDEDLLKVELLVGRTLKLDPDNRYVFGGCLEQETVTGWGYEYFILKSLGPMAGTLMAVDPAAPKVDRFITLGGELRFHRYNSRLPLVVYVPQGVEVRYRIWRGNAGLAMASEG